MAESNVEDEVYKPPKRRESEPYEHLDEHSVEFIRKALRGQFRRSEHSIIKLEERLIKMGCQTIDSEEEKERKENASEEDNVVEDFASVENQNRNSVDSGKGDNCKDEDTQAQKDQKRVQGEEGKHFNFTMRNMHSMTMNRKLSLIENVQKNYGKYIRPSTETDARPGTSPVPKSMSTQFITLEAGKARPRSQDSSWLDKDQFVSRSNLGLRNEKSDNLMKLEGFEQDERYRIRSKSNPDTNEDLKKQHRLIVNSAAERTTERWKKTSFLALRRKREADERWKQIQEIHQQVTRNRKPKFPSVSLPSLALQPSQRNEEFYKEMRIITEALQAINTRLDEQLKILKRGVSSRPPSKKLLKLPKIELEPLNTGIP